MCDILIASVVIRLLSARCIKSSRKRHQTHCGHLVFSVPQPPSVPTGSTLGFVLLNCNDCSLLCFILQKKGPSLVSLPAPRFCCWNVLSAPHITGEPPKTAHQHAVKRHIFLTGLKSILPDGQNDKKRVKNARKENVTKMWNPSKCIHVSCRWKSNPRCQAQFL